MGIHPTEEKVQVIKDVPILENVSQLHAFLGLVNYYSTPIPNATDHLPPPYKLLEKNNTWQWGKECIDTFQQCKSLLTSEAVLVHYDVTKQLKLSCDASQYGLVVVLSYVLMERNSHLHLHPVYRKRPWH